MSVSIGRKIAAILLATAAGSAVLLPAGDAQAGDVLAAGILGGVVGALLVPPPYPVYGAPVVVYEEPVPVYPQPVYAPPPPPVYYAPSYEPGHYPVRRPLADIPAYGYRDRDVRRHRETERHDHGAPRVITYEETVGDVAAVRGAEPWSEGWFRYCENRFRTFDADTGTYMGYDGQRHFCTVK